MFFVCILGYHQTWFRSLHMAIVIRSGLGLHHWIVYCHLDARVMEMDKSKNSMLCTKCIIWMLFKITSWYTISLDRPQQQHGSMPKISSVTPRLWACFAVKRRFARFKYDVSSALHWSLRVRFPNLVYSTYFHQGYHFVALELPFMLYTNFLELFKRNNFINKLSLKVRYS